MVVQCVIITVIMIFRVVSLINKHEDSLSISYFSISILSDVLETIIIIFVVLKTEDRLNVYYKNLNSPLLNERQQKLYSATIIQD